MPEKKGIDFISITIILLAIALIGGGVYLLQKSFSIDDNKSLVSENNNKVAENNSNTEVDKNSEEEEELTPEIENETEEEIVSEDLNTEDQEKVEEKVEEEVDQNTQTNPNEGTNENQTPVQNEYNLEENQIVVNVKLVKIENNELHYSLNEKIAEYNNEKRPWLNTKGSIFYLTGINQNSSYDEQIVGKDYTIIMTIPKQETFSISEVISIKNA